jgi:hypothetical protein
MVLIFRVFKSESYHGRIIYLDFVSASLPFKESHKFCEQILHTSVGSLRLSSARPQNWLSGTTASISFQVLHTFWQSNLRELFGILLRCRQTSLHAQRSWSAIPLGHLSRI